MRIVVSTEGAASPVTITTKRIQWRRYGFILFISAILALAPFIVPLYLMNLVPRIVVVTWYTLLALVAGCFGIMWILSAARLAFAAREADIQLAGEIRERVFEVLRSAVGGTET
jgi:ABC-type bacteriocin/lantibiotic exporter with double-glycine peptidase domain